MVLRHQVFHVDEACITPKSAGRDTRFQLLFLPILRIKPVHPVHQMSVIPPSHIHSLAVPLSEDG